MTGEEGTIIEFVNKLLEEMKEMRHANERILNDINDLKMRINEIEVLNAERMRVFSEHRMILYWVVSSALVIFSGIWRYIVEGLHKIFQ